MALAKIPESVRDNLKLALTGPGAQQKLEAVRETLRFKCRQSLWFFNRYALEMQDIDTPLHHDMCEKWQIRDKATYSIWLVPRGHLKSSLWTEGGNLWHEICNPDQTIMIANETLEGIQGIISNIRNIWTAKESFRWLFPEYCIELAPRHLRKACKDLADRLDFPCSKFKGSKEGNLDGVSLGASRVGRHYHRQHYDDIVSDKTTTNKTQLDANDTWYRNSLQLSVSPKTKRRLVGTRWHFDDPYGRRIRGEQKRRQMQVEAGEKIQPKYLIYIRKAEEVNPVTGELEPIWPERFSKEELADLKRDPGQGGLGSYVYSCQYENNPVSSEDAIFRFEDIQPIESVLIPDDDELEFFAAMDLADEETTKGDYFVITVAGFHKRTTKMYVREIFRERRVSAEEVMDRLFSMQKKWSLRKVACETVAFQRVLFRLYKKMARDAGVNLPFVEMKRGKTTKRRRFLAFQPRVQRGDFYYEEGIRNSEHMVDEMTTYDKGVHDDILDTLADLEAIYYTSPPSEVDVARPGTYEHEYGSLEAEEITVDADDTAFISEELLGV